MYKSKKYYYIRGIISFVMSGIVGIILPIWTLIKVDNPVRYAITFFVLGVIILLLGLFQISMYGRTMKFKEENDKQMKEFEEKIRDYEDSLRKK